MSMEQNENVPAQPSIDFSTLQLDDPRITEECKQTFTQLVGRPWPGPGEYEVFAAIWAMARLSAPESSSPSFDRNALRGDMRELGCTTNGQTSDLIDLFEHHLEARHG